MGGGRTQPHETKQRSDRNVWTDPMATPSYVSFPRVTYRAGCGVSVAHMRAHVGARYKCALLASVLRTVLCGRTGRTRSSPPGKAVGASAMNSASTSSSEIALVAFGFWSVWLVSCLPISALCAATSPREGPLLTTGRRGRLRGGLSGAACRVPESRAPGPGGCVMTAPPFALSAEVISLLRASGLARRFFSSSIRSVEASMFCGKRGITAV